MSLSILGELMPEGIQYGTNLLVEFQADSVWYESSLTIAASALKQGVKTEYHAFQHTPTDIMRAFTGFGLDVKQLEQADILRLIDDYSVQMGLGDTSRSSQSLKLSDWSITLAQKMKGGASEDREVLHVDDNISILTRYNPENVVIDWYRTRAIPVTRSLDRIAINGLLMSVASESFYRQIESLCDGIIEFRSQEKAQEIEQYVRARIMRGQSYDSRWRKLRLLEHNEVALAE